MDMHKITPMYPSFATNIHDEIYRSMDGGNEKCQELKFYNNRVVKNTSMYPSFASSILDEICYSMDGGDEKQSQGSSVKDEDMTSLPRACLLNHEKSRTSCFTTKRPEPVKTTSVSKKKKQSIWSGSKLVSFVNSLFRNGNSKKMKNSNSSSTGGYRDGDKENKFSIFVHSRPGFLFNKATTRSAYFLNRQKSVKLLRFKSIGYVSTHSVKCLVDWEEASMILAKRIVLKHALLDPFNERFLFLSDSCIPLYTFSYMYDYLMSITTSFVDSFANTKEGRYNPKMHPVIPWVVLTRKHAEIMVKHDTIFPLFQRHCKANSCHVQPDDASKEHNCIPDKHYVQTLLAIYCRGVFHTQAAFLTLEQITQRTLTHTSWDPSSSKDRERWGWHPITYKLADATTMLIQSIKDIDNIYYETEYRREWCTNKGKPSSCFLFARKFTRPATLRLLNMAQGTVKCQGEKKLQVI
ncbi:hypothetical protein HYC85_015305 [Camellia sinensis]|uniref:Uncharacterized protein n=1 Tax=Camellia sinensis TaxID=4442 RepID=A0A7J7GXA7_CAMSI|nr:hypothetical protein HYC85_015305 [Camellia sinensis]